MQIGYDNCKDCVSRCEHAGKDREFVYSVNKGSCKVKNPKTELIAVVRCRDCKWFYPGGTRFDRCLNTEGLNIATEDSFCFYGEHKSKGGKS